MIVVEINMPEREASLINTKKRDIQSIIIPQSIIVDDQLKLLPLVRRQAKEYFELVIKNQDRIGMWFSWATKEQTLEETIKYLNQVTSDHKTHKAIHLGIFFEEKLIGQISLTKIDSDHLSLSISGWIDKDYEGKKYFLKASFNTIKYIFEDLGFNRVEVRAVVTNERSHKLFSMLRKEGTLKEAHKSSEKFLDIDVYGLLKSEWFSLQLDKIIRF